MPIVSLRRRPEAERSPMNHRLPTIPQTPSPILKIVVPIPSRKSRRRPINTALHQAVLDERIRQVRLLVRKHGADVNSVDVFGRTPLMLTCMLNNEEVAMKMAKLFIDNGATFNQRDVKGRTILSYACMKGKVDLVRRILSEDIFEINEPDNDGCTPLHHCAVQGNPKIMDLLVRKIVQFNLTIDRKDKLGYSALLLACKHGWYRSGMILLVEGFASPCVRDSQFFLNAVQWIHSSRPPCGDPQAQYLSRRSKTVTAIENTAKSFDRSTGKSAMYRRHLMQTTCKHTKDAETDPFSSTDIDLPPILPENTSVLLAEELRLKRELLDRIQDLFPSEKERPSTAAVQGSRFKPTTAKLRALRPDGGDPHSGSENISNLLRLYANHYAQLRRVDRRPVTVSLVENAFRQ